MEKFDLIQLLGNKTCNGAANFLTAHQTCTQAEAWSWGAILVGGIVLAVAVHLINARRQTRRENYYL